MADLIPGWSSGICPNLSKPDVHTGSYAIERDIVFATNHENHPARIEAAALDYDAGRNVAVRLEMTLLELL